MCQLYTDILEYKFGHPSILEQSIQLQKYEVFIKKKVTTKIIEQKIIPRHPNPEIPYNNILGHLVSKVPLLSLQRLAVILW